MIPGVNPRQLQQMMKQMGMSQDEINATQVIIKTPDKTLIFDKPDVQQITMKGQVTFQLSGNFREEAIQIKVSVSDEDIKMVSEQAGVSIDDARKALDEVNGDIAQAIVNLTE